MHHFTQWKSIALYECWRYWIYYIQEKISCRSVASEPTLFEQSLYVKERLQSDKASSTNEGRVCVKSGDIIVTTK